MITLRRLAELADAHRDDLDLAVSPLVLGDRVVDVDERPVIMGCVNLSRDSTYRESIATSIESAVRKGRVLAAQGADVIDLGAESSTRAAARVDAAAQIEALTPVIRRLADDGLVVSAETYDAQVARACLEAGARMINFTGAADELPVFDLVAEFAATVVVCHVRGANVREVTDVALGADPLPHLQDYFSARIELARSRGVGHLVIDPGMGFFYGNLVDPRVRMTHQAAVIVNSFRLRRLGLPICHALPHAFEYFEDQFRTAEGLFAVLALLGGTGVLRTHEVAQVAAVVRTLGVLREAPAWPA